MPQEKLFWTTVPGILTGIASLIVALTGIYVALNHVPKDTVPSGTQPTSTPTTVAKTPFPSDWPLIAEETFTKADADWTTGSFPEQENPRLDIRVVDGRYRWDFLYNQVANGHRTLLSPYGSAVNFEVATDVRFTAFTDPVTSNLVFGSGENEQYEFLISSSGYFALFIYKLRERQSVTLLASTPIPITANTAKFDPKEWNRMGVVVDDQVIRCYLKSELLGEYKSPGFTGGKVGLGVGTEHGGSGVIDFDNFEYRRKPQ